MFDEENDIIEEEKKDRDKIRTATGHATAESAYGSIKQASTKFSRPDEYTGNRNLFDDNYAKSAAKKNAFNGSKSVKDPYTGEKLVSTIAEAKEKYGDNWQKHVAESDHIKPLEKIVDETKKNPWLTVDDVRRAANSEDNLEVVSRKYNNAKRSRTNQEYVEDQAYLKEKGVKISKAGKERALEHGTIADKSVNRQLNQAAVKNMVNTGHSAGKMAAQNAMGTAATMSGVMNIVAVINGEKDVKEALIDVAKDTGKATVTGYAMGNGLTVVAHSLSNSSSKFIQALVKSNVPGKIITAVMATGDTLKRFGNGEITTEECIMEIGEKGLNLATIGYSSAIGQSLIPIPVVGAAVGALVGSVVTSKCYRALMNTLQSKSYEREERRRITAECEMMAQKIKEYRLQMESYLDAYFQEYQSCFDEAFYEINMGIQMGDADGIISGANRITRQLGGKVYYENTKEYRKFLKSNIIEEF